MDKTGRQRLRKVLLRSIVAVFFAVAFAVAVAFTLAACDKGGTGDEDEIPAEVVVTELEILKAPKKTVYTPGETFDGKGMVLRAIMSNGKKKPLTIDKCTYSPDGALTENDTQITVTYGGKSVNQPITVANMSITISSETVAGKTFPNVGVRDLTDDINVVSVYSDSKGEVISEKYVTDYELVLDYQPSSGAADKDDIVCTPDEVKGFTNGSYKLYAKVGDVKSSNALDVYGADVGSVEIASSTLSGKRYATLGTFDFTSELTVTGKYTDHDGAEQATDISPDEYKLVLKHKTESGHDLECAANAVTGLSKGSYAVHAKACGVTSANGLDISVFGGFIVEAENVYDADYSGVALEEQNKMPQYAPHTLPDDIGNQHYTLVEKLRSDGKYGNEWPRGAEGLVRPGGNVEGKGDKPMPEKYASGGYYLGDTKILSVFSFHIYSEYDTQTDIYLNVASSVLNKWYSGALELQMNKTFEVYIGDGAYNAETDTFDASKKVNIADDVKINGTKFDGDDAAEHNAAIEEFKSMGLNENDYRCSRWTKVLLGEMNIHKGWNVIYFKNLIYDNGYMDSLPSVGPKWGFNIDSFELEFKE